jgi:hypothetical protein
MARPKKGITFWDRVSSQTVIQGECHVFTGHKDECGYGRIFKEGRLTRVHRAVFERDHGPIADGLVVRHTCDNPGCINSDHLVIGTQADNIADMDMRGRRRTIIGSQRTTAKLHEMHIPTIRQMLAEGHTCLGIALAYDVTEETIRHIKKGRIWRHA